LFLDDDEILSSKTARYLSRNLAGWDADIIAIPLRHYILGMHDERAYYWPEEHHRLFRRGAIEFIPTVHGGVALQSDRIFRIPGDSGVCIHHLSYPDVASWIERTNRYTGRSDRIQVADEEANLIRFAHGRIDYWMRQTDDPSCNDYPAAVALLRSIYDIVDRLKNWESVRGLDGAAMFRIAQKNLVPEFDGRGATRGHHERDQSWEPPDGVERLPQTKPRIDPPIAAIGKPGPRDVLLKDVRHQEMQAALVQLRATEAQLRERIEAERRTVASLTVTRNELNVTAASLTDTRNDLDETRARLDRASTMRDQTQAALVQAEAALVRTEAALARTEAALARTEAVLAQTEAARVRTEAARVRTEAALVQTQAAFAQSQVALDQTRACLAKVRLESERLSGSAHLFVRQYLPKLARHLSRWLP
jgi:hypothetical protein